MSDSHREQIEQAAPEPATAAPDILAELGPLAYGLFALAEPGRLTEIRTLADSRAAQVPAQAERTPERDDHQDALLGELGELDL